MLKIDSITSHLPVTRAAIAKRVSGYRPGAIFRCEGPAVQ
jgi:hypothetical protein